VAGAIVRKPARRAAVAWSIPSTRRKIRAPGLRESRRPDNSRPPRLARRTRRVPPLPGAALATALAPPDWESPGCPVCRRPPGRGVSDHPPKCRRRSGEVWSCRRSSTFISTGPRHGSTALPPVPLVPGIPPRMSRCSAPSKAGRLQIRSRRRPWPGPDHDKLLGARSVLEAQGYFRPERWWLTSQGGALAALALSTTSTYSAFAEADIGPLTITG
jgi:hypothetical protein